MSSVELLNLGCGEKFHPAWTNIDVASRDNVVIGADLRQGIPFPAETFNVVYHSHLLEHFSRLQALPFLQECCRVLKPGGIIRVVVPDLERMVRLYLRAFEEATRGNQQWQHHYEWIKLELYDQSVRERSGGDMMAYLRQPVIPNRAFVLGRIGLEGRRIIERTPQPSAHPSRQSVPIRLLARLFRFLRDPVFRREWLLQRILGAEYEILQVGQFRRRGEVHLWMYDGYSLAKILRSAGFQNPQSMGPTESQIPEWPAYHLDAEPDGTIYKPESLYMEAVKCENCPSQHAG